MPSSLRNDSLKCPLRSLAMVVAITWLQLRSGMKSFLPGWKVSLRLDIASATLRSERLNQVHKEESNFVKEKKENYIVASPIEKVTKIKNSANSSSATAKYPSEYT
ncbi:hypothetical protein TNCV_2954171 [Trichonephila clavipes]|nr:hypothetical protein TNCV_2954171 [Trichonephila clavipes]